MATKNQAQEKRKILWLKKLGKHIKNLREEKGLSGSDLGARIGVYKQHISQIELAEVTPSIWRIKEIADALEMPLSEFFQGVEK